MRTITSPLKTNYLNDPSFKVASPIERTATALWQGNLENGKGSVNIESETVESAGLSFTTRFENEEKGTNPEELLAAAHAGCFTMSVAAILSGRGLRPLLLDTLATVKLIGSNVIGIHLKITGIIDNIDANGFKAAVKEAESNCLISKILNIPVTSEIHFVV